MPKGSKIPELNKLIIEILDLALEMDAVMVDVLWIPSELNVVPDDLSRMVDVNDWTVRPEAWTAILGMWPQLTVDRFADEWNAKLPRFSSRFRHPSSKKANGEARPHDFQQEKSENGETHSRSSCDAHTPH